MDTVRYVIVVHGMGEARENETVLPAVSRFAEARSSREWPPPPDVLTLGAASGQTGVERQTGPCRLPPPRRQFAPWLAFRGIPQHKDERVDVPFYGERAQQTDEVLRFVDVHWSDLLTEDFPGVGQSPGQWVDGVIGRLRRKEAHATNLIGVALAKVKEKEEALEDAKATSQPQATIDQKQQDLTAAQTEELTIKKIENPRRPPQWALEILDLVRETALLFHRYATLRAQQLDELVFAKYLGDVQLYGEYVHSRGRAVRRFHEMMERIERAHKKEEGTKPLDERRKARYTVIAHSLGTVMSMDALLYAHAKKGIREGTQDPLKPKPPLNLPFPGYLTDAESDKANGDPKTTACCEIGRETTPFDFNTDWVERVDAFVTMGAPIDKFLVVWWLNYKYMGDTSWMDLTLRCDSETKEENRIKHFNYCEEQDPVGHNLDVARTAPAFKAVFDTVEDKVYTRYAYPGFAHISYWKDRDLFRWILHRAVDHPDKKFEDLTTSLEPNWFDVQVYHRILFISYRVIPTAVTLLNVSVFALVWYAESWHVAGLASVAFFGVWLTGRYLVDLNVWWRLILHEKFRVQDARAVEPLEATARQKAPTPAPHEERPLEASKTEVLSPWWKSCLAAAIEIKKRYLAAAIAIKKRYLPALETILDVSEWCKSFCRSPGDVCEAKAAERARRMLESCQAKMNGDVCEKEAAERELYNSQFGSRPEDLIHRELEGRVFRGRLAVVSYTFLFFAGYTTFLYGAYLRDGEPAVHIGKLLLIAVIFSLLLAAWIHLFYRRYAAWQAPETSVEIKLPAETKFPFGSLSKSVRDKIVFDNTGGILTFEGIMSSREERELRKALEKIKMPTEAIGVLANRCRDAASTDATLSKSKRMSIGADSVPSRAWTFLELDIYTARWVLASVMIGGVLAWLLKSPDALFLSEWIVSIPYGPDLLLVLTAFFVCAAGTWGYLRRQFNVVKAKLVNAEVKTVDFSKYVEAPKQDV